MITADQYMNAVADRVRYAGGNVFGAPVGPVYAMIGQLHQDLPLLLGTSNFCVVVASIDTVNGFVVSDFTRRATAFAKAHTQGILGFGAALFTYAGIVASSITPDGVAAATARPDVDFGASSRPILVDVARGALHMYTGTPVWGFAAQNMIKDKARQLFPPPGEVLAATTPPPGPPHGYVPPTG